MFEEREIPMDALLSILAIEKLRYDNGVKIYGEILDIECFWETCYIALEDVASSVSAPIDECNAYIQKFCFPSMEDFYRLCREYGRKNQVSFKNNRYVKEATDLVNYEMNGINDYCINWCLFTPKKTTEKKWPCLAVFTSVEFYQPVQLVQALYNIRSYYKEAVKRLEEELASSAKEPKRLSADAIIQDRTERKIA